MRPVTAFDARAWLVEQHLRDQQTIVRLRGELATAQTRIAALERALYARN